MDHVFKIDQREIRSQLKKMKNCKSCGPDGITSDMLKIAGETIIPYLVRLFNVSINNESVPDDWKSALIVPIFKSGQKCEVQNYRPVSLTSVVCKCLKNYYLIRLEIIWIRQNGFFAGSMALEMAFLVKVKLFPYPRLV